MRFEFFILFVFDSLQLMPHVGICCCNKRFSQSLINSIIVLPSTTTVSDEAVINAVT